MIQTGYSNGALRLSLLVVFASGVGACAGTASVFPSPAQLDAIAAKPTTEPHFLERQQVNRWQFSEPAPVVFGSTAHEAASPAGALLSSTFMGNPRILRSGGLECVAREYGRFWLAYQAMPAPELETYIQARCGEPVAAVAVRLHGTAGPGGAALSGAWRVQAQKLLAGIGSEMSTAVGMWSGEGNGQSVAVVATGLRLVKVEPIPLDAGADGALELRGRLLLGVGSGEVFATRGARGFVRCDAVPGTAPPQFHYRCPVDPADPTLVVEMMYAPPDALLGFRALVGLFAPGKPLPSEYAAPSLTASATAMSRRDGAALLAAINGLRRRSGFGEVREMATQSAVTARMLPHYFSAMTSGDLEVAEDVALGLMAGWAVRDAGMIRSGHFGSMNLFGVASMEAAVESLLLTPVNRALLLDPESEAIALATREHGNGAVTSALVTAYSFFRATNYDVEVRRMLARLDAQRAAAGQAPVVRIEGGNSQRPLLRARDRIKAGRNPMTALTDVLDELAAEVGIRMRGQLLTGGELNTIVFPSEIVNSRVVQIDIDIDHYQPKGSPWGQFFVLMIYAL